MSDFQNLNSQFSGLKKIYLSRKGDKARLIIDNWEKISGNYFNKKARPDRIINGELFVKCESAVWIQQGNFFKEDLMKKCNDFIKEEFITNIKFFVGDGKINDPEKKIENFRQTEKKFFDIHEKNSEKDMKKINDVADTIEDEELRNALKKVLYKAKSIENSLTNQGWKKCKKCFALYNKKNSDICFVCEQNPDKPQSKIKEDTSPINKPNNNPTNKIF